MTRLFLGTSLGNHYIHTLDVLPCEDELSLIQQYGKEDIGNIKGCSPSAFSLCNEFICHFNIGESRIHGVQQLDLINNKSFQFPLNCTISQLFRAVIKIVHLLVLSVSVKC